jgi:hypothetical protein
MVTLSQARQYGIALVRDTPRNITNLCNNYFRMVYYVFFTLPISLIIILLDFYIKRTTFVAEISLFILNWNLNAIDWFKQAVIKRSPIKHSLVERFLNMCFYPTILLLHWIERVLQYSLIQLTEFKKSKLYLAQIRHPDEKSQQTDFKHEENVSEEQRKEKERQKAIKAEEKHKREAEKREKEEADRKQRELEEKKRAEEQEKARLEELNKKNWEILHLKSQVEKLERENQEISRREQENRKKEEENLKKLLSDLEKQKKIDEERIRFEEAQRLNKRLQEKRKEEEEKRKHEEEELNRLKTEEEERLRKIKEEEERIRQEQYELQKQAEILKQREEEDKKRLLEQEQKHFEEENKLKWENLRLNLEVEKLESEQKEAEQEEVKKEKKQIKKEKKKEKKQKIEAQKKEEAGRQLLQDTVSHLRAIASSKIEQEEHERKLRESKEYQQQQAKLSAVRELELQKKPSFASLLERIRNNDQTLTELDLRGYYVLNDELKLVADAIANNNVLLQIDLTDNIALDDESVQDIAKFFDSNSLRRLYLKGTSIKNFEPLLSKLETNMHITTFTLPESADELTTTRVQQLLERNEEEKKKNLAKALQSRK